MYAFRFRIACSVALLCCATIAVWPAEEEKLTRTPDEVKALVQEAGKTPPAWLAGTPLNMPKGLSLRWSARSRAWNPVKNIEHYLAVNIDPQPERQKEGIKLLHRVLDSNKGNEATAKRSMRELAHRYFLLGDHAHALWYYNQGGRKTVRDASDVARSYEKLGNARMSANLIAFVAQPDKSSYASGVRQWAEAGNLPVALKLAEGIIKSGKSTRGYLAAGDACRCAGDFKKAQEFYKKAIASTRSASYRQRAQAGLTAAQALDGLDLATIADGLYTGSADGGYRGAISVEVVIKGGKMTSVKVAQTRENRDYESQTVVPGKIVARQSIRGVDAVTGATLTSVTVMNAVGHALAQARK